jgi:hypothetical protein
MPVKSKFNFQFCRSIVDKLPVQLKILPAVYQHRVAPHLVDLQFPQKKMGRAFLQPLGFKRRDPPVLASLPRTGSPPHFF